MRLIAVTLAITLFSATISQVVGFTSDGQWLFGLPGVFLAALWGIAIRRNWHKVYTLLFLGLLAWEVIGLWAGKSAFLMILSCTSSLAAWITAEFLTRFRAFADRDAQPTVVNQFVLRLTVITVFGLAAGWLTAGIKIQLGIGIVMLLGLVSVWGLSRLVRYLRGQQNY